MSNSMKESLSALMDGEASELELRRLLASDDPSLRQSWADMHRSRDVLHDGGIPFPQLDVSVSVMQAISGNPVTTRNNWKQSLVGAAVAAGVAAVVVFVANVGGFGAASNNAVIADTGRVYPAQMTSSASGGVAVSAQTQSLPARQGTVAPAPRLDPLAAQHARERFEQLLRKHTDNAALNNSQGIISYARVVDQESN